MLINDVYICTFFEFSIDKCFDTVNRAQIYKFFSNLDIFFAENAIFFAILSYYCNDIPYKYKIFIILSVLLALVCVQI